MEPISPAVQQANDCQLIEIRKTKSDFESTEDYLAFRTKLLGKAINPWLEEVISQSSSELPDGVWALCAGELKDGEVSTTSLLDFIEMDFADFPEVEQNFDGLISFADWVADFNPRSWGDWLMVPKLFSVYIVSKQNLPVLAATPDPWVDAVLRESRGRLIWTNQFTYLIRVVSAVGVTEARNIYSAFLLKKPGWEALLENTFPPAKQPLMQIFKERTVCMQSLGMPDYILSDWLSNHFEGAVKVAL